MPSTSASEQRWPQRLVSPAAALGLLAVWLLATLGWRPLLVPDEGRYASVARAMLGGDPLVPTLNGLPFFHKPPLMYWIDMAAMAVFGAHSFSTRIAPALGAWLMGAALFFGLRRWHGAPAARGALLVLATCPFFFIGAQYANHDMLVAGLITAAVLAFVRAVDAPPRLSLHWLVAAWVMAALAVLAKGLIGIVLPALIVGPWLLAQRRWRQVLQLLHPLGLAAGLLVAAPWFVAMQLRYPGFFDYFFMEQHFRRYAQTTFNNAQPFWFFIALLPLLTLPWSLWLPAASRQAWRERGPRLGLYAWWVLAVVAFFSMPNSKLAGYALPALAPWCALLALAVGAGRARAAAAMVGALLCVGLVAVLAWKSPRSSAGAALVLAAQMQPLDRVVFVDEFFYDLPFIARLAEPVIVASDWATAPQRDNWRKELFDAARFDPARARQLLWPIERLGELACGPGTVWFVASPRNTAWQSSVPGLVDSYADANVQLQRAPGRVCP